MTVPVADLSTVPDGADLFIDANIFIYAFLKKSAECRTILVRCAREEITGITSLDVVSDVTHRMMLAEAVSKGEITRESASELKRKPASISALTEYWNYTLRLFSLNVLLLDNHEQLLIDAQSVRSRFGLLTKDSLIVSVMDEYAITNLATRDDDFGSMPHLTVFKPTDI
jgi:predicted nucleic acid-binding protein